jgi:hypothetical protein
VKAGGEMARKTREEYKAHLLRTLERSSGQAMILLDGRVFSPKALIEEVRQDTEIGRAMLDIHIEGEEEEYKEYKLEAIKRLEALPNQDAAVLCLGWMISPRSLANEVWMETQLGRQVVDTHIHLTRIQEFEDRNRWNWFYKKSFELSGKKSGKKKYGKEFRFSDSRSMYWLNVLNGFRLWLIWEVPMINTLGLVLLLGIMVFAGGRLLFPVVEEMHPIIWFVFHTVFALTFGAFSMFAVVAWTAGGERLFDKYPRAGFWVIIAAIGLLLIIINFLKSLR